MGKLRPREKTQDLFKVTGRGLGRDSTPWAYGPDLGKWTALAFPQIWVPLPLSADPGEPPRVREQTQTVWHHGNQLAPPP